MRRHREPSAGVGLEDAATGGDKSDEVSPASAPSSDAHGASAAGRAAGRDGDAKPEELAPPAARPPPPFGSLAEAFGYVVFLVALVLATAVLDEDPQAFFFATRVSAALSDQLFAAQAEAADGASPAVLPPVSLGGIHDQAQAWAFLSGPFLDAVYGDAAAANVLLGGVVLRTLRVTPGSCEGLDAAMPEYAAAAPHCYGAFRRAAEQTAGYGQALNAANVSAAAAYQFAAAFFADAPRPRAYADLQTCRARCAAACAGRFGAVDAFRYADQCAADCATHCTCVYEQPAGFARLCADPGAGAPVPAPLYPFAWVRGAGGDTPLGAAPTGAYVAMLPADAEGARAALGELRQRRLLDLATRALVADLVLFSPALQLLSVVRVALEFPATGGARATLSDVAVRVRRYGPPWTPRVAARAALEALVLAHVAWRWRALALALARARGLRALARRSAWHLVTLAQLLGLSLWAALRLYESDLAYGLFTAAAPAWDEVRAALREAHPPPGTPPTAPPDLRPLAAAQSLGRVVGGGCVALSWLKLLQFGAMFRRSHLLLRAVARAGPDLAWGLAVLAAAVCAFAQVGVLLFGLDLRAFRSLPAAVETMLHAVAGAGGGRALDYARLQAAHPALGPLFYVGFYLLLLLVVVNVFWAVVSDAYAQTLAEQEDEDEELDEDEGLDAGQDADRALAAATKAAAREAEQLRRYPFSKGVRVAAQLLAADVRRALYELRTGRPFHAARVDPVRSSALVLGGASMEPGAAAARAAASRKLGRHVRGHVARELRRLEPSLRVSRRVDAQQTQIDSLRAALETDVGERLAALAESSARKAARLQELEAALGAIEGLCRQLVADTAFLRADGGADGADGSRRGSGGRVGTPPAAAKRSATGRNPSLSAAILASRQRESRRRVDGDEIEEIAL